jgi:hypothetical protein
MLAMLLLPVLGVSALEMQAPPSDREIEQALVAGVRTKLAQGWTLASVEGDYDELTFTLTKGKRVEQHVAHIDHESGNALRIDTGVALPHHLIEPTDFMVDALVAGGGIEIGGDCGRVEARAYMIDASARGADAAVLVATTLRDSDDVESASLEANLATFSLDTSTELRVTLDDGGKVLAAEVRRHEYGGDTTTHTRQDKMKARIGERVTRIVEGTFGPTLHGDKRFTFHSNAFESNNPDDHSCGC